jgi:hypothetical protein
MDPSVKPTEPPAAPSGFFGFFSSLNPFKSSTPAPTPPVGGRKSKRAKTYRKEKRPAKRRRNGRKSIRS